MEEHVLMTPSETKRHFLWITANRTGKGTDDSAAGFNSSLDTYFTRSSPHVLHVYMCALSHTHAHDVATLLLLQGWSLGRWPPVEAPRLP